MARARNIKPAIFVNELLGTADIHCTVLFISLWCLADCEGKLEDRPLRIKTETFPYRDDVTQPVFNGYLTELERLGFIHRYSANGINVIKVVNFNKHQSPHHTEKPRGLPDPLLQITENTQLNEITVKQPLRNGRNKVATRPDLLIPDLLKEDLLKVDSCDSAPSETPFPETERLVDPVFKTEVNETLRWIQERKRIASRRNLPAQDWLDLFTDLEDEKILLNDFKRFYEFCEKQDWVVEKKVSITPNVMRSQIEQFKSCKPATPTPNLQRWTAESLEAERAWLMNPETNPIIAPTPKR